MFSKFKDWKILFASPFRKTEKEGICTKLLLFLRLLGCVAQLNRASDYGSEGFRFES